MTIPEPIRKAVEIAQVAQAHAEEALVRAESAVAEAREAAEVSQAVLGEITTDHAV